MSKYVRIRVSKYVRIRMSVRDKERTVNFGPNCLQRQRKTDANGLSRTVDFGLNCLLRQRESMGVSM